VTPIPPRGTKNRNGNRSKSRAAPDRRRRAGDRAVDLDLQQTATPHAIVTDVRLGAFNGLHLVLLAKERAPATTAIVYSGREDCGLRQEAATSGATYPEKEMLSVGLLAHLHGTEASA
jgi:ActR/RegA family two-component response regulator